MNENICISIASFIAKLGFYSTTISDAFLIFLTVSYLKKDIGPYRHMITLFAVLGIVFSSVEFLALPIFHSYNAGFVLFSMTTLFGSSNEFTHWLIVTFGFFYSSTISLLAVQFIYRYWATFDRPKLIFFHSSRASFWCLYVVSFSFAWGFGMHTFGSIQPYTLDYLKDGIYRFYGQRIDDLPCIGVVVYDPQNHIRWHNCTYIFIMTAIMASQYSVMIFCGVKLNSEMHQTVVHFSPSLRKLHNQIFRVLVLQVTLPTVFLFAPVVFIIYLPFLNWKVSLPSGIWLSGFTLYPAIDAFLVMYIITDYHKAIRKVLLDIKRFLTLKNDNENDSMFTVSPRAHNLYQYVVADKS